MGDQLFASKKSKLYSKPKYQVHPLQQTKAFDAMQTNLFLNSVVYLETIQDTFNQ